MSHFVIDVESDGACPPLYSMVSFAIYKVTDELDTYFKGLTAPISDNWKPDALAISNISREEHLKYPAPEIAIKKAFEWVKVNNTAGRPIFWSDNVAFDYSFMNYYFHRYIGENPFGWSGRRIGDIFCGLKKDAYAKWKHLRKTIHSHDPVDDSRGNAEVLLHMRDLMDLKIGFK
jgi:hypothetical protein